MRSKIRYLAVSLAAYISSVSAQGVFGGQGSPGSPGDLISGSAEYTRQMLGFPPIQNQGEVMMWVGGFAFTLYSFRKLAGSFSDQINAGLDAKEEWFYGLVLTLIFIGYTNFMGWINDVGMILWIGAALLLVTWFLRILAFNAGGLGSVLGDGFGWLQTGYTGAAFNYFGGRVVGGWNNWRGNTNNVVNDLWSQYNSWPKCDIGHANPQHRDKSSGTTWSCWVNSCSEDVNIP